MSGAGWLTGLRGGAGASEPHGGKLAALLHPTAAARPHARLHPVLAPRRNKHESALRSAQAQREGLERRLAEQERAIEARLDGMEGALQVSGARRLGAPALAGCGG